MRIRTSALVVLALAATSLLAFAAPAGAKKPKVRVVKPGHSIQAAINAANPGDTILVRHGTYRESIQIDKDRITLKGQHAVLKQPANPADTFCNHDPEGGKTGICVVGQTGPPAGEGPPPVVSQVERVRITGFTVTGFTSQGIFIYGGDRTKVDHNRLIGNGEYGVFSNTSSRTRLTHNVAARNHGEAGLYVGDSPNTHSLVDHNRSVNNHGEGLLLRDTTHGRVSHNRFSGNCAGIIVLADNPGPATDWVLARNRVTHNNRACAGSGDADEPPLSGLGIGLLGGKDIKVSRNVIEFNRKKHPSFAAGGLWVGLASAPTGTVPSGDVVTRNVIRHNSPFDIDVEAGTVAFSHNHCKTSKPSSAC